MITAVIAAVTLFGYILGNSDLATWGDRFAGMTVNAAILAMLSAAAIVMADVVTTLPTMPMSGCQDLG